MQKVRCRFINFNRLLTTSFRSFTPIRAFFTFPLRYFFSIGYQKFLGLSVVAQNSSRIIRLTFFTHNKTTILQDYNLLWIISNVICGVTQYRIRSPLLTASRLIFLKSYLDVSVHFIFYFFLKRISSLRTFNHEVI